MSMIYEALTEALEALDGLIDAGRAVKESLRSGDPEGQPVHPISGSLTWPLAMAIKARHKGYAILDAGKPESQKPAECAGGCPEQQVCDYCQGTGGKDNLSLEQDVSNSVAYAKSTPSLNFGYSTPEPQAQAGEPRATAWVSMQFGIPYQATTDEPTAIRWCKAGGDVVGHISLQSHREAMAKLQAERDSCEQQADYWQGEADNFAVAIAKKDAALKACVEALSTCISRRLPFHHVEQEFNEDKVCSAITQAQEAL